MQSLILRYATTSCIVDPHGIYLMELFINFIKVRDNYLEAIDNLQQVDRDVIFNSETQNRSSSRYHLSHYVAETNKWKLLSNRLIDSLERFLDEVEINNFNTSSNTTKFLQQTFALQVQNIDISSLNGETFNVDLGSVAEAMNITRDIEESDLITIENVVNALSNATAAIHVSEELLEYCTRGRTNQRLGYSVFLSDTLFRNQDENTTVGSLIIAARLRCGENSTHPPVNVTLLSSNEVKL